MNKVVYAPNVPTSKTGLSIFLAGSIEMGKAEDWQSRVINELDAFEGYFCTIFNPRRPDWDDSWEQSIDNPKFREQVEWELNHLKQADIIALYLAPGTVSPISLLEFGLYAKSGKLILCCPKGFERKGNVDIVAQRYLIPVFETFEPFIGEIKRNIIFHAHH